MMKWKETKKFYVFYVFLILEGKKDSEYLSRFPALYGYWLGLYRFFFFKYHFSIKNQTLKYNLLTEEH